MGKWPFPFPLPDLAMGSESPTFQCGSTRSKSGPVPKSPCRFGNLFLVLQRGLAVAELFFAIKFGRALSDQMPFVCLLPRRSWSGPKSQPDQAKCPWKGAAYRCRALALGSLAPRQGGGLGVAPSPRLVRILTGNAPRPPRFHLEVVRLAQGRVILRPARRVND